ncbi:MAG: hypothetical protein P4N59_30985 [Negativicutes bacterium]|nr:hypothetical protein [Negativicutes bacterium]
MSNLNDPLLLEYLSAADAVYPSPFLPPDFDLQPLNDLNIGWPYPESNYD